MNRIYVTAIFFLFTTSGCDKTQSNSFEMKVADPALQLELIAEEPDIMTPIGMAIDDQDAIYVLESHTHTPPKDYKGPKFDRIKKSIDEDGDGKPEGWIIYADSLEDGMNMAYARDFGLFVTTKNSVLLYQDNDGDGISDERHELLSMVKPEKVYDHAGILGLAYSPDGWLYVSRGNTGGQYWQIEGTDHSTISGYGDGGNVFRCRMDGSELEEVATGFWNPFDLKFSVEGRLLLTDNDPDSRGPNRLIEVVPGGNYGYKSIYGGSGIHPFLSWNGELPGTLPYAAPLGEAPCALVDAGFTNFGDEYLNHILVNVWEENNIVRIPLSPEGSSVVGKPDLLIQGDSLFHPVAFATNSKGELYITDWVIRQYPNHGHGKIWRLTSGNDMPVYHAVENAASKINRFARPSLTFDKMTHLLETGDEFEKAMVRRQLAHTADFQSLSSLIGSGEAELRLQALLIFLEREEELDKTMLRSLLKDTEASIRQMTLVYTGTKMRRDMEQDLHRALISGNIDPRLFETFLAAVRHIQPVFIKIYGEKSELYSKDIPRRLPDSYITDILNDNGISEATKAVALPYLDRPNDHQRVLLKLLGQARDESFQIALMKALKQVSSQELASDLIGIAQSPRHSERVRSQALLQLGIQAENYCSEVKSLLENGAPVIQYAAIKYLCRCTGEDAIVDEINQWISENSAEVKRTLRSSWAYCNGTAVDQPEANDQWIASVNSSGNAETGRLVFESLQAQCLTCHKVDGWGGTFGPDLSNIGSSKSKIQLINSILNPSLEIAPEWQSWYVTDKDGVTHYGRQIDVHLDNAELMNANGSFDTYENPESFGVAGRSLMPEGLQNVMTKEEFNDLIAYLMSLK